MPKKIKESLLNVIPQFKGRRLYIVYSPDEKAIPISLDKAIYQICSFATDKDHRLFLCRKLKKLIRDQYIILEPFHIKIYLSRPLKKK